MSGLNKLQILLNLLGSDKNVPSNVSINTKLDANVLKELQEFDAFKLAEGNVPTVNNELLCPEPNKIEPNNWTYAVALYEILLRVDEELNICDEFPLSINEAKTLHNGIRKAIEYGLKPFLLGISVPVESRLPYVITSSKVILNIVKNKFFPIICTRSNQHLLYTDLVSSIFLILRNTDDERRLVFEEHLQNVQSKLSHTDYFRILFLIMGSCKNKAGSPILQIVHTELMQTLHRTGSFVALCDALMPSITSIEQDEDIMKKRLHSCTAISSIIGKKGHGNRFYHQIIDEIFWHISSYIQREKSQQVFFIDAAVQSLRKLYMLQSTYIQHQITQSMFEIVDKLAKPDDLLAGAIVCDEKQFTNAINLIHLTFCASGPSDDTLPSELLTNYMPLFIQLHHTLIESLVKNELLAIIIRCLSNRDRAELNQIIEIALFEDYSEQTKHLHTRIKLERVVCAESDSFLFSMNVINPNGNVEDSSKDLDFNLFLRGSLALVDVLKKSNHNTLIFNVFLCLLQIFVDKFGTTENTDLQSCNSEFLGSESELKDAIEMKFKNKYAIINALNELIQFKQFHGQFNENSEQMFTLLKQMLSLQIERIEGFAGKPLPENIPEILVVILLCVGEFMNRTKEDDSKAGLMKMLEKLRTLLQIDPISSNVAWKIVLQNLNNLLNTNIHSEVSEFITFKNILSDDISEPYTKVYGIMNIIKLIKAKDEETCSNAHIILLLSMKLLRESEDSYIFLNCIKLLISLFDILGETVLDALITEYHCDIDSCTAEIDFKLKIGETIVKVIQLLGEMCYNHKDLLLNCFMRGIYHENDEFRTSNMSNLGSVMMVLSCQVHHYFQEIILAIQNTLLYDKYLPARRAAASILTDLLKGMQNLEQYQDFLLPIYRNLKTIAEKDLDLHMQIHARNGLECLTEKIKNALAPELKMEKEINIFDIKKTATRYK